MRKSAAIAIAAAASLIASCGGGDGDGSPTSAENEQLDNIANVLDTSADSLAVEETDLGNGEGGAETGDVLVADDNAAANAGVQ
jgi:hypothetical protein